MEIEDKYIDISNSICLRCEHSAPVEGQVGEVF